MTEKEKERKNVCEIQTLTHSLTRSLTHSITQFSLIHLSTHTHIHIHLPNVRIHLNAHTYTQAIRLLLAEECSSHSVYVCANE